MVELLLSVEILVPVCVQNVAPDPALVLEPPLEVLDLRFWWSCKIKAVGVK